MTAREISAKRGGRVKLIYLLVEFLMTSILVVGCARSDQTTGRPSFIPSLAVTPSLDVPTMTLTPDTAYNFEKLIDELEQAMPGAKTDGYVIPTSSDLESFADIVHMLIEYPETENPPLLEIKAYELLTLDDSGDARARSYVLQEKAPPQNGWGLYFFRIHPARNIVIEAPHPRSDINTEELALDLYRALDAKALLVAGAHRNANFDGSADVAHAPVSVFNRIHMELFETLPLTMGSETIFIQIHGFDNKQRSNAPDLILSYNWANEPDKDALLAHLVAALNENQIQVGVCNGNSFPGLCGTSNVQRLTMNGGIFLHIELSSALRNADRTRLINAMRSAFVP